jgi:3-oxoacyl-[acyl-carrier protein] reductase
VSPSPRVAIVTGAASGIGRHWATVLAARGDEYRLALVDVNAAGLCAAFASSERLRLHAFDVRSVERWQALVDDTLRRFGRIDYLFNIAGGGHPGFLLDVPMDMVDTTIDVNLKAQIYGMKSVAPVMVRQGAGHIVNVASLAGISPTPGHEIYSAAKSGLRAISLSTAVRLRPLGVFVTVVCPDLVDTPAMARQLDLEPEDVALIHSGPDALSVVDVEQAFVRAMRDRPLEITIPTWRGWLAKVNNLYPRFMLHLYGPLMRRGLKHLEYRKRKRLGSRRPVQLTWRSTALRATLSWLLGILTHRRITGLENIPRHGPCLLVFNQLSLVDTPLLSVLVPRRDVTGLVAKDYRRNPVYRFLIECGGGMWIRRATADRAALEAGLTALRQGWVVGISPEGRRSPTRALIQGKPGPAFLARRSGAPIVPVAFANTDNLAPMWRRFRRPTVDIRVGEPFHLPAIDRGSRKQRRRDDMDWIMCHIAELLPPQYRGVYAEHPYLRTPFTGLEPPREECGR